MKETLQLAPGIAAFALFVAWNRLFAHLPTQALVAGVWTISAAAALWGPRAPLWLRTAVTLLIVNLCTEAALVGRTIEPGLRISNFLMALLCLTYAAVPPLLVLPRLWKVRSPVRFQFALFGLSLNLALALAAIEERQFAWQHAAGIGPTSRWTVPSHWLAVDERTGQLFGSD